MSQGRHDPRPVLRFAPSPNGHLHLGHAYSAIFTFEKARQLGARFLLRIEDIDVGRTREDYVTQIYEDLAWLGLEWETPTLRQSKYISDYAAAAQRLKDLGLVYPCFATRAEIQQAAAKGMTQNDPDGSPLYPGLYRDYDPELSARRIASGELHAMRLDMRSALSQVRERIGVRPLTFAEIGDDCSPRRVQADPMRWGDVIIQRRDVPTSYHLSVVVDDARQGVTHVTRGLDLRPSTDVHRLLQVLLELPEPVYQHHRLIVDGQGRKLSKSARDISLSERRAAGKSPGDIRRMVGLG